LASKNTTTVKSSTSQNTTVKDKDYTNQIEQLVSQIQNTPYTAQEYSNPYAEQMLALSTPKTDAEYLKLATDYYTPQHNAQVMALEQANAKENLAYENQLAQLATAMQDSRESTNATYAKNISDLNNNMLRRGIARSSYAGQIEANARTGWANALSKLERDYQANVNYVGQQQQLATSQLAQNVARLKTDLATNIANYQETLKNNDKNAQMQAYSQLSSSYDNWAQQQAQLQAAYQQSQTSNVASLLQFLADYNQSETQFNQQMELQKQKATNSKAGGGGNGGPTEPTEPTELEKRARKTYNEMWNDFNSSLGLTYKKQTASNGSQPVNIYSAAAQYALEQIRRQNGEI
jgi:hypothetical protein